MSVTNPNQPVQLQQPMQPEPQPAQPAQAEAPQPAPEVPQAVQNAEQAVVDRTPKDLQASVKQVEQSFNDFEQEEAVKAKANVESQQADAAAKDPNIEKAAEAATVANVSGVLRAAPGVVKEVKAGYKTTEFWITIAGVVLTQLGTLHLPGKYGDTITTAALLGSYALSRGLAKR